MVDILHLILFVAVLALALFCFYLATKLSGISKEFDELSFSKASQSVKYGKLTEQFVPFIEGLPFDSGQFRFIGNPIDGIAFCDDEIIFCEFKAGSSELSQKQKNIKRLVEGRKVRWIEHKIK